jgi:multidrug efflux pump subunit AcrB
MITINEIMASLANWNRVSPAGEVDQDQKTYSIRLDEQMKTVEAIKEHTLKSVDGVYKLKVKDLGDVRLQNKEVKQEYLVNGKRGVSIQVYKQESADIVNVATGVSAFLENYKFREGVSYITTFDDSENIQNSLKTIVLNALFGLALVLISLTLFVSTRLAIITAVGIPVAFLGGLAALYVLGMTLNTLVVLGMVVVLGMLVDDAIVVAENIYAHVEDGLSPYEASVKGVTEVASPVIATVLTTVFAFLPVVFMEGIMGQFLRVIPIAVIVILTFSLFEALLILPTHCADFLKPMKAGAQRGWDVMGSLKDKYVSYVTWATNSKLSISAVLLSFTFFVFSTFFVIKKIKFELFPRTGIQSLSVTSEFPLNTQLEESETFTKELYEALSISDVKDDIFSFSTTIGAATIGGITGVREQGSHLSSSTIRFVDDTDFIYREKKVIKRVKEIIKSVDDKYSNTVLVNVPRPGPPVESDVELMVFSRDFSKSVAASEEVYDFLKTNEAINNLRSDLTKKVDYYRIAVDKDKAVENGLSFTDISRTVFSGLYGVPATQTRIGDDEVDLVVSLDKSQGLNIDEVNNLLFLNKFDALVPLKYFASVKQEKTIPTIQRMDGKRAITVFGDVNAEVSTPAEENAKLKEYLKGLKERYPSVSFEVGGADLQRIELLKETGMFYGFSIVGIFIVISLSFISIGFPFLVLFAVPFGLIGVIWALFLHSMPLSVMGLIGVVGLSGVVVNSSIILIQFFLKELREGVPLKEALVTACSRRFRPIVITSITTLLGLAPTIYSVAGKDAFIQPLVLALGWGLFVSTLLTLFILPTLIYVILCKLPAFKEA